jgi:hypothetical protein
MIEEPPAAMKVLKEWQEKQPGHVGTSNDAAHATQQQHHAYKLSCNFGSLNTNTKIDYPDQQ